MTSELSRVLSGVDPDDLRATPEAMRSGVADVVHSGADLWVGPWAAVVDALREVARVDLCLGRLVEGHLDAMRILDQAKVECEPGVYGVWASRSAGTGLAATPDPWRLDGQLRFASGIDLIDRALVPGWIDADHHLLFDVGIDGFDADRGSWGTAAMDASRSFTCRAEQVAAGEPIGPEDFYLSRPGFAVGGIGPAAVWSGGAHLVVDIVTAGLAAFRANAHQRRRLGRMRQAVWTADAALARGVAILEDQEADDVARAVSHVRTAVVNACDTVLAEAPMIVGPGGLTTHRRLARAIADLGIYVRQHHLDLADESYGEAALAALRQRDRDS